jgi:hypothetical protein
VQVADSDEIFLAGGGLEEVVGRVVEALGLQGGWEMEGGDGERGYVGQARTVEEPMGVFIGPSLFPPEPGELQAMDAYPVMVDIQFRTHKPIQAEEARLAFEAIVAGLPDVPALLLHNVVWLVASYLPGRPVHYFEPRLTPDAEDVETWGSWVVRGD